MDAESYLRRVARAMKAAHLEGVLVGNAGAALQGAPVTTLDFDFFVRRTKLNERKMRQVAKALHGGLVQPYEGLSDMHRIITDDVHVDLIVAAHGIKSFESLRSRATVMDLGGGLLLRVADLRDIIRSKRAANRKKDRAVLPILEETLREKQRQERE